MGGRSSSSSSNAAAALAASSRAVEEPMRLLLALVRAVNPCSLLRPYARRFVQQLCYLLLADGPSSSSSSSFSSSITTTPAAVGSKNGAEPSSSAGSKGLLPSPLLEGESLTAALAVVGELAVISPEDLRPYVDLLMPRCVIVRIRAALRACIRECMHSLSRLPRHAD